MKIRGLIGVIHLPPMPGDPRFASAASARCSGSGGFSGVLERALEDAAALALGGVDALLVENLGSAPYAKGSEGQRLPPHQVATLALAAREISRQHELPLGVNCLRNDARAAIGIAAACGLDFVRVNVHTGAYVTDQGLIEGEAERTLRYRAALGAEEVAILADVLVKHAAPLAPISAAQATRDCLERGLADGVIITGGATGSEIDLAALEEARGAAAGRPVFLGSGVTRDNVARLAPGAAGAIVGTSIKRGGEIDAPVDEERVRELVEAASGLFTG